MNSNRNLWITLLVLLLIVCCCCCALAWGAGSLALGGFRMGASAIGPDMGGWQQWFRSFGGATGAAGVHRPTSRSSKR